MTTAEGANQQTGFQRFLNEPGKVIGEAWEKAKFSGMVLAAEAVQRWNGFKEQAVEWWEGLPKPDLQAIGVTVNGWIQLARERVSNFNEIGPVEGETIVDKVVGIADKAADEIAKFGQTVEDKAISPAREWLSEDDHEGRRAIQIIAPSIFAVTEQMTKEEEDWTRVATVIEVGSVVGMVTGNPLVWGAAYALSRATTFMFERRAINRIGLNDLGLGHQIVNILRDGGIDNLKQLRNLVGSGDGALLAISGIGPKRLELVKQALG